MKIYWLLWVALACICWTVSGTPAEARALRIDIPVLCGGGGGTTGAPGAPTAPYNASGNFFGTTYDPTYAKGFDFDPGVGNATINACSFPDSSGGNVNFAYYSGIAFGWSQTTGSGANTAPVAIAQAIVYLASFYVYTPCSSIFGPTYCALNRGDAGFGAGTDEIELNYPTGSSGQCMVTSTVYFVWAGVTYAHSPSGICGQTNDFVFYGGCCDVNSPYGSQSNDGQYFGFVYSDTCRQTNSCVPVPNNPITPTVLPPGWYIVPNVGPASVSVTASTVRSGFSSTLSVIPTGGGPYQYQWYAGTSGSTTSPIAGATGPSFTTPALTTPTNYWVKVIGAAGAHNSATTTIDVFTAPAVINTMAGNGKGGFSGDNGPATSAALSLPYGIAVDRVGNLYVADTGNSRVRMVSTSGVITTIAGNGVSGFSGDNGPATSASLESPYGVAVDAAGNVYIADGGTGRVRMVNTSGIINTVAGGGTNLSVTAGGGTSPLGDGGAAPYAILSQPSGVAIDGAGNLYIADQGNGRIRLVNSSGIISTVAGGGTGGLGDGGLATAATLCAPFGVTVDLAQQVYVADTCNNRVRKFSVGGNISTIAGNGSTTYSGDGGLATSAGLGQPDSVAVDLSGNVYIADRAGSDRIRMVNGLGIIVSLAGNGTYAYGGDGGPASSASLYLPAGVAVDSALNVYVGDSDNNRVRLVSSLPTVTETAAVIPVGTSSTLTANVSGIGPYTYQWYTGASGNLTHPIAAATGSTYTTPDLTSTATYWVLVTSANGNKEASPTITITVTTIASSSGSTDGPLPLWALAVLSASLLGVASHRLRPR